MSHHINITSSISTVFWILHNSSANRYLSGYTNANQITTAGDEWELQYQTNDVNEWITECERLSVPYDAPEQQI